MSPDEERELRNGMLVERATRSNNEFRAGAGLGLTLRDRTFARDLERRGHPVGLGMRIAYQMRRGVVPEVVRS